MSDEIGDIMKSAAYPPVHRVTRSGAREPLSDERKGEGEGRYGGEEPDTQRNAPVEELVAEVAATNERLAAAGRKVRLRLAGTPAAPVIEILMLDGSGLSVMSRQIAPSEIDAWIARIETAEGLLLDDTI